MMEREITHGQLHLLQEMFCRQAKEQSIVFPDDEQEELCLDGWLLSPQCGEDFKPCN